MGGRLSAGRRDAAELAAELHVLAQRAAGVEAEPPGLSRREDHLQRRIRCRQATRRQLGRDLRRQVTARWE